MHLIASTCKRLVFVLFLHQVLSQIANDTNSSTTPKVTTESSLNKRFVSTQEQTIPVTTPLPKQPSTNIPANTDIGPCPCDLTAYGCDVNCCCDSDCSADDQQAFSYCISFNSVIDDRLCFPEDFMTVNVPFKTNVSNSGILCIYYDNKAERNYYKNPHLITNEIVFTIYESLYLKSSYKVRSSNPPIFGDFYKSGNSIYVMSSEYVPKYFSLPTTLATEFCVDDNPAAYLVDKTVQCVRDLKNLDKECESSPGISAYTYFKNFKVVVTPKAFERSFFKSTLNKILNESKGKNNTDHLSAFDLYNGNFTIAISNITICGEYECIDQSEFNSSTNQFAPVLTDTTCKNVVNKVVYHFIHNGTYGIISISVTLQLISLQESDLPFTQTFSTEFQELGAENSKYFKRSGNPGYVRGEPLLAGIKVNVPSGGSVINLNSDRTNWLTIPQPSPDGSCTIDNRVPVTFGVDMRSGCFLKIRANDFRFLCDNLENMINTMWNQNVTHVAKFGNSAIESVGDWVTIIKQNKPPQPQFEEPNQCSQVVTGMQIQVLYAKVGSISNPQPKIIGVSVTYEKPKTISLQCGALMCNPTDYDRQYNIEMLISVAFQDVSLPAVEVFAENTPTESGLPYDFFYPFYSDGSENNYDQVSVYFTIICAIFQMFLLP